MISISHWGMFEIPSNGPETMNEIWNFGESNLMWLEKAS